LPQVSLTVGKCLFTMQFPCESTIDPDAT